MNDDEVRGLLARAASGPVDADRVDPMTILRAGRRRVVRRRRIGAAVAGGAAAMLAVGAAVGIPLGLGDDTDAAGSAVPGDLPTQTVDDAFLDQWNRFDHGDCALPEGQSDEQARISAAANQALFTGLAALGAEPLGQCLTTRPDHDGFHYDNDFDVYTLNEALAFGDDPSAVDWIYLRGGFWYTGGEDFESQMESEECFDPRVTCSWDDTEAGRVLLIEGVSDDFTDPDTESGPTEYPIVEAFLFRDEAVVSLGFSLRYESEDLAAPDLDDVTELLLVIPVGDGTEAPETEPPAWDDLTDDFAAAIEAGLPGVEVAAGTAEAVRLGPDIDSYGGPVYGTGDTYMVFVLAELASGETVRFFLQAQVVPVTEEDLDGAAAGCGLADCEQVDGGPWNRPLHRTIGGERPSLTALEYRTGDGWLVGVGAEAVDGGALPPVDAAALDAILTGIR
ncbi:hypothetical protein SAMN05216298_2092 [Glycomyces sambucus]|uniref:Uncharacterized protein n=1 Tax=Glycomyces sambucus TaxID=380244 RepID=A0A1G9FXL5_9ACTN|nr:hypothetical protein [Glycomyces sambucus]SDK93097.1 hypothetical protein SAMN05216298_2092 [Glycomyces sambucus]